MSGLKQPFSLYEYIDRYLYGVVESGQEKFNLVTFFASVTYLIDMEPESEKQDGDIRDIMEEKL